MLRFAISAFLAAAVFGLSGCASEGRRVPADVEAVTTHDFNPTDLQLIGQKSVKDLLAKAPFEPGTKPAVYVARVRKQTDEHINTDMIADYITNQLSDSGRVDLIGVPKHIDEAVKALEFQRGAFVDPSTAQKVGKMIGAAYFVQGDLASDESKAGRTKGQYFLFTLTLVQVETLRIWTSQVEIQKVSTRGLFGW